jgi:hypothetical protein
MCYSRFNELCAILEPGKPPKADKVAILSDAARLLSQLRAEAQKLKQSNESLQDSIKSLKVLTDTASGYHSYELEACGMFRDFTIQMCDRRLRSPSCATRRRS